MNYQLSVSEKGIKKTLKDMFTSPLTFLTELCQNSQRAGASKIDIEYIAPEGVLVIADDGHGFNADGWEAFFTVGSSAWHDDVIDEQNPFGIGCAACLFASKEILIQSGTQQVWFSTSELLSGKPVHITNNDYEVNGTMIALRLADDISINRLIDGIDVVFSGFTIPLFFNGREIERPLSLDNGGIFHRTELGMLMLVKDEPIKSRTRNSIRSLNVGYILQGFKLKDSDREPEAWLHLNPGQFRARVPDRDCLVGDVTEVTQQAKGLLAKAYCCQLEELHASMAIEHFVLDHWFEAKAYAPHLIQIAPLPHYLFTEAEDIPYEEYDNERASVNLEKSVITQDDIRGLFVFDTPSIWGVAEDDEANFLVANYSYLGRNKLVDASALPQGHWILQQLLKSGDELDNPQGQLEPQGQTTEFELSTAGFYRQKVILCEAFSLTVDGLVNYCDEKIAGGIVESKNSAIWFEGVIYVPSGCSDLEAVCRQVINMNKSEWDFELDQDYLAKVSSEFWSILKVKRGGSYSDMLKALIQEHNSELGVIADEIAGKSFSVTFTDEDKSLVVSVEQKAA